MSKIDTGLFKTTQVMSKMVSDIADMPASLYLRAMATGIERLSLYKQSKHPANPDDGTLHGKITRSVHIACPSGTPDYDKLDRDAIHKAADDLAAIYTQKLVGNYAEISVCFKCNVVRMRLAVNVFVNRVPLANDKQETFLTYYTPLNVV